MPAQKSLVDRRTRSETNQPAGRWFARVLLGMLIASWGISAVVPIPLVLPALSIFMVVSGFVIAAVLYLSGSRKSTSFSPAWEVAGALVFFGVAAAILADTREALAVLDQMETSGRAAPK